MTTRHEPTTVVEIRRSLDHLAHDWDGLVDSMPLPSPFLKSWWVDHASRYQPAIVTVTDDGELIGGLALEIDRRLRVPRWLTLGSDLGPDHIDIVHAAARRDDVVSAIRHWVSNQRHALFDLTLVRDESALVDAFAGIGQVEVVERAPWVSLPADYGEYFAARRSQVRNTVQRNGKRLINAGVAYTRSPAGEVERDLADLHELHGEVFGAESLFLPCFSQFSAVARAGVRAGDVVFHRLDHPDGAIAVTVMLETAGRTSYYQVGRRTDHDWRGCGVFLESKIIEDACHRGITEFDHLRGNAPYKADWAPELRDLLRIRTASGLGRLARPVYEVVSSMRALIASRKARPPREGSAPPAPS